MFFIAGFYLSAGFFPISNGPKSKQFSEVTNILCKYDSGGLAGRAFLQFQKMLFGRVVIAGKSL